MRLQDGEEPHGQGRAGPGAPLPALAATPHCLNSRPRALLKELPGMGTSPLEGGKRKDQNRKRIGE